MSLKTGELNTAAEAVIEIEKKLAPDASPYVSAKTFEELNLSEELLRVRLGAGAPPRALRARQTPTLTLAERALARPGLGAHAHLAAAAAGAV